MSCISSETDLYIMVLIAYTLFQMFTLSAWLSFPSLNHFNIFFKNRSNAILLYAAKQTSAHVSRNHFIRIPHRKAQLNFHIYPEA